MSTPSVVTIPKHIHHLEITARVIGASAHLAIAAMIVTVFLAIANVTSIYPFIGLLAGAIILVSIEYGVVEHQSREAKSLGINLTDAYGKSFAHNQFVDMILARIEKRKPIRAELP